MPSPRRKTSIDPEFARIDDTCDRFGLSKTRLYRLAREGKIKLVRLDGASLVDCASVRAFIRGLPPAELRPPPVPHEAVA